MAAYDVCAFVLARISEDEDDVAAGAIHARNYGVRWSPARVLAECAAKRRIVMDDPGESGDPAELNGYLAGNLEAIRLLATAWSDHPLFRPEWRY